MTTKNQPKTVTVQFIPHTNACLAYRGGVLVNPFKPGLPMIRIAKARGVKKMVETFAAALTGLAMVKVKGEIVWLA